MEAWILSLVTFFPVVGAMLLLFLRKERAAAMRWTALMTGVVTFLLSLVMLAGFDSSDPDLQMVVRLPWFSIGDLQNEYFRGVDGLSILLVLLTTFLTVLSIVSTWTAIVDRVREFMIFFLLLETGMVGVFLGMDLFFFYVFWEFTLVPMYFLIGVWGGERRMYAAIKFFLYTMAGGMWAVALTDFVQMIVIALGLVLLLVVVLIDVGGWGNIAPHLPEDTFRMIPADHTPGIWLNYIRALLIFGLADVTAQTLLQRAFSAKDERTAQNSFYLAGFGHLSLGMIPVTLGIIASVTMPEA